MDAFDHIAEQKIREALARGEFDRIPNAGRPLELEDLSRVPEELRAGYLLLKGAGVLPEELQLRKETLRLEDLIAACQDEGELVRLRKERTKAALRYALLLERRGLTPGHRDYADALAAKLGEKPPAPETQ